MKDGKFEESDIMTIFLFPSNEKEGEMIVCFRNCSKCGYLEKCDHADPYHY